MNPEGWRDKAFKRPRQRDDQEAEQEDQQDRSAISHIVLAQLCVAFTAFIDNVERIGLEKTTPLTHGTAGFKCEAQVCSKAQLLPHQ